MDTIGFGPDREPRRWRPGWLSRRGLPPWRGLPPGPGRPPARGWPRGRVWLGVVAAATAVTVTAVVLVTAGGPKPRAVSSPSPSVPPLPTLLAGGVPVHSARTDLFLGGENFWRMGREPQAVDTGFLLNGLSPLLPYGHGAEVDQLAAVPGGVVAHISDISTGITYGAVGRVVFIPAANAPARVIARATMIAVSPSGQQVWVQAAIESVGNGQDAPANVKSPTWAVNLAGRRITPVYELPLGLVGATASGPLTQNLSTGILQLWNGATGRPVPLPPGLPADENFIAAGNNRVIWSSCVSTCRLHITDLDTGANADIPLPTGWWPTSETYPPPTASFDPSGQRFVLPLDRVDSSGYAVAEDLFVADTATGTLRMILARPLPLDSVVGATQPVQLAGAWDPQGLLWVLATNPYGGYYQLGFWTGGGPLRTFAPARGSPIALSAPGPTPPP